MNFLTSEKNVLGRLLDEKAEKNGDKPYIYFEDQIISYRDLHERTNRVANGLVKMGVKKGDKVAIAMENCPELIYTWFALSKIGAIEVPINIAQKGKVLEYLLNYCDAQILVITNSLIPQIKAIEDNLKEHIKTILVNGNYDEKQPFNRMSTELFQKLFDNPSNFPQIDVKHNDLMAIMFTSGTTGPSKGVMITHNQALFVGNQYVDLLGVGSSDLFYLYIPLFHMAAQFGMIVASLLCDSALVLRREFSAASFWKDINRYSCTISGMFEAVLKILMKDTEKDGDAYNTIKAFATAHIPPDIHEPFEKRFGVKLVNVYGLTEGDCICSATHNDIRVGSFGKPRGYFDVRVFDQIDQELPTGKVGEVVVRPSQSNIIFEGYYKMPGKTLETFKNLWWHTGDLAYKDEEGYFYFVGREKDMIRRGGENISALEVEMVVESHPDVKECAAMATPSDIWGEEVKIVVIKKEGKEIEYEDLIRFCDDRMAYFAVPRFIEFIESIPRTGASQRPIKSLLRGITVNTWDRVKAGVKIQREIQKGK